MDSDRLLSTFLDLVRIDSPSGHEGAVAAYCADVLRSCGCTVVFDGAASILDSNTGNLYAVLEGTAPGSLVLTAHMDCVQPCEGVVPIITDGVIHTDGSTVLGGDDKVGVAAILEAVRCCSESAEPHATVKVIFTIEEEVGCRGAKAFFLGDFESGEPCFVFDMDGAPGTAVLGAPYHYKFTAEFEGKASHAGVAPEQGISAIEAAAHAIVEMRKRGCLGAVGEYCASNVGSIEGGGPTNVVPASCRLTGECRAVEKSAVEDVRITMDEALRYGASRVGAKVDIDWICEYEGFLLDEHDPSVHLFQDAARSIGMSPTLTVSVGGSDANVLSSRGLAPMVVATGMTAFHSTDEHLKVADLEATARLAVALISTATR